MIYALFIYDASVLDKKPMDELAAALPKLISQVVHAHTTVDVMTIPHGPQNRLGFSYSGRKFDGPVEVVILAYELEVCEIQDVMCEELAYRIKAGPWIPKEESYTSNVWLYNSKDKKMSTSPIARRLH